MVVYIIFLFLGFFTLIKGADLLVSGASSLAKKYHVSELVIGLTIVAFGTSAPELVVNINGAVKNLDDIVLGNIIGSNIFNLLLILGISGVIYPLTVSSDTIWKEIPYSFLAALALFVLANDGLIFNNKENLLSRIDGAVLLALFVLFLLYTWKNLRSEDTQNISETKTFGFSKIILFIVLGLTGLVLGGRWVVNNAVKIANELNLDEKFIGLTIVSIGTSLPELVTSIMASIKKKSDLAIGNIVGSNIFNVFFILGLSAVIKPIHYQFAYNPDVILLMAATLFVFIAMFTGVKKKLDRWEAIILLVLFLGYTVYLFIKPENQLSFSQMNI